MPFNDPTNRNGLIQSCERWTNLGAGTISGDANLLADFTAELNESFDELMPLIYGADAKWQWDDSNHPDQPIATFDLASGQQSYSFISDEDGNSILEIDALYIKDPIGEWRRLTGVDSKNDSGTDAIFAQNSNNIGTPTRYDKLGTSVFLDPVPNYDADGGIRIVFKRAQSYFATDDTTKSAGIPRPFHKLLPLIASRNWLVIHKAENIETIAEVKEQIKDGKAAFEKHLNKRSGDERIVVRPRIESSR
jgi:hypothetical protein